MVGLFHQNWAMSGGDQMSIDTRKGEGKEDLVANLSKEDQRYFGSAGKVARQIWPNGSSDYPSNKKRKLGKVRNPFEFCVGR